MAFPENFHFRGRLPESSGALVELNLKEMEELLIKQSREENEQDPNTLTQLVSLYLKIGNQEAADSYLRKLEGLIGKTEDSEKQAGVFLRLGSLMEGKSDFHAAILFYKKAVSLNPSDRHTRFFAHNNLGFSLNQIGDFQQGEHYCFEATKIDRSRSNGFKNLALAFQGQGKFRNAADNFVRAVQADAGDPRSAKHLEDLLKSHPELEEEFGDRLAFCKKAVGHMAGIRKEFEPKIHRGFAKWLILRWMSIFPHCRHFFSKLLGGRR